MRRFWFVWVFMLVAIAIFLAPALAFAQEVGDEPPPLDALSNADLWGIFVGMAVPFVVAAINRVTWDSAWKWLTFFAASLIAAAGTVLVRDDLDRSNYLRTALLVLASATTFYLAWRPAIKDVEVKTG